MSDSENSGLFAAARNLREPLAARMRPRNLDEYIGQDHIVGKGRLLRRAIAADQLTSVIFYGPPGSGKTTLARVIANHTKSNFITLNAVLTGVADIRAAIKQAEDHYNLYSRRTILFVDEVHRWNRAQQDALLPWVENGTIILIGATTENPFFEVNKALVSRSRVFQLKALESSDLRKAAEQALSDSERGYGHWKVEFEDGALEHLIETANGDARSLLNALELAVETTPEKWEPDANPPVPAYGSTIYISRETAEESIQKKVVLYDRDGDYHYDIISAFIKSLRGRDPDAAMYWLARMTAAGEDPRFIFRRMLISACEDTGLADPYAVAVVNACAEAFDRVGLPEGRYFLAHAALYLATAEKSNSSMAFFDALSSVEKEDAEVPNHLRDSSRDAEGFGHGAGYLYPHAYRDHWVAQQYLPDALAGRIFYTPSDQGYERKIRAGVLSRRELQIAAILEKRQGGSDGLPFSDDPRCPADSRPENDGGAAAAPAGVTAAGGANAAAGGGLAAANAAGGAVTADGANAAASGAANVTGGAVTADGANAAASGAANAETACMAGAHGAGSASGAAFENPAGEWRAAEHLRHGDEQTPENLTFSPENKAREGALDRADRQWRQRLDSNRAEVLLNIRNTMISLAQLARHHRCLVWNADDGLLIWEVARRTPEGVACGVCRTAKGREILEQYSRTLGDLDRPSLQFRPETLQPDFMTPENFYAVLVKFQYEGTLFDRIFFRDPFVSETSVKALAAAVAGAAKVRHTGLAFTGSPEAEPSPDADDDGGAEYGDGADEGAAVTEPPLAKGWRVVISQRIPSAVQHISVLVKEQILSPSAAEPYLAALGKMDRAETEFFNDKSNRLFRWNGQSVADEFRKAGLRVRMTSSALTEKRRIGADEIHRWFDPNSAYGRRMAEAVGNAELEKIVRLLENAAVHTVFDWRTEIAFFSVSGPEHKAPAQTEPQ